MKKLFFFLLFFTLLFSEQTSKTPQKESILTVAISHDMIPYSFIDKKGEAKGMLVDYWKLWAEKTNQKIKFIPMSWKEGLNAIKKGTIHIHSGLYKTKGRSEYINYIKTTFTSIGNIYINSNQKNLIKTIKDLEEKKLGVIEKTYFHTYMKKNHPKIKLQTFQNFDELFNAIEKKHIDAFFDDSLSMWFLLMKNFKYAQMSTLSDFQLSKMVYAGIQKNNSKLEALVHKGMNLISQSELKKIENKWIIDDELRFLRQNQKDDILTQQERLWLSRHPDIKFAVVKVWERFSKMDEHGQMRGFHIDLLGLINKTLNTNFKYKVFENWTQAYESTKASETMGIFGLSWSSEREAFFNFSSPYYFSPYHLITREKEKRIQSITDANFRVAATYENSITNKIVKLKAPNAYIIHKNNAHEILQALKDADADVALLESAKAEDLKKYNVRIVDTLYTKEGEMSIGTPKDELIFATIIQKALQAINKLDMESLTNMWFYQEKNENSIFTKEELEYIRTSPAIKVGMDEWKPIIFSSKDKPVDGIGGEIMIKAFKTSGLKIEYVKSTWDDILTRFKEGKLDILSNTAYTKTRSQLGLFTDPYLTFKHYIYTLKSNNNIRSLKDLKGKRVAIVRSFAIVERIKKAYPSIKVIETDGLEDSIQSVINGSTDALIGTQIATETKIKELLITNLKAIAQNELKANSLHFLIKKDNSILQSIINKSLLSIPRHERNQIITKWLSLKPKSQTVNLAFGKGKEPFVLDSPHLKGIEYALVKKILDKNNIKIGRVKNLSRTQLQKSLSLDDSLDMAVVVKKRNDGFYYSNDFLEFQNVVISKKEDNFEINSMDDLIALKDKRIIAFKTASNFLGTKFSKAFSEANRPSTYREITFQEKQVKEFLEDKADLIILDQNIFKWHLKRLSSQKISEFQLSFIFDDSSAYQVAFKNKYLRDLFNKNLEEIKRSGEYEEVFFNYIQSEIEAKVQVNTLISSLVSQYIFSNEIQKIEEIIDIFEQLDFIKNIEVYDNDNILLASTFNNEPEKPMIQDSFYFIANIPQKVGYVKVIFDEFKLTKRVNEQSIIPNIKRFESLNTYSDILSIYKRFGYLDRTVYLNKKEKAFLKAHKKITFTESSWIPMTITKENRFSGIIDDFLKLIESKSGLTFQYSKTTNWDETINAFKEGSVDVIPGIGDVAKELDIGLVSNSYLSFKYAIVTNESNFFADGLKDLKDKIIAVPRGYSIHSLLKNKYPYIKLIDTTDDIEAMKLVLKGDADVFVQHSAVVIHHIKNTFPELSIAGFSEETFNHHFLIQRNLPELLSIINKTVETITDEERDVIKNRWIKTEIKTGVDYTIVYAIILVFTFILIIILFFTRKLSMAKKEIESTNNILKNTVTDLIHTKEELINQSKALEEQKNVFETLYNDTSDGFALIQENQFIDCNSALLKMFKYKNKKEFLQQTPFSISPTLQPNGESSDTTIQKNLKECLDTGNSIYEWVYNKANGKKLYVDVVLTRIILNNERVIHVVLRDIEDKKDLESQIIKRNNELENANNDLEVSLNYLKQTQEQLIESEKMASLGSLVAGVAHEVNTPIGIGLTGITHFQEISKDLKTNYKNDEMTQEAFEEYMDTSNELADIIHSNLKKAASLVKSFKQVAVDQSSEELREFDLKIYMNEILSSLHNLTKKTKLNIIIECEDDIKINSYPGAFSQIISNFIINSIKHGFDEGEKGEILISVTKQNNQILLVYKDNGKGIPKQNMNKIFNPFFTTKRNSGGSGLGLNIIYNIVTSSLKGKIDCESEEGFGVKFSITFNV